MYLKHFRTVRFRVADPMRPGRSVFDERLDGSGTHSVVHDGHTYEADDSGWFDLPDHVGAHFARYPGWRTPEQVDEEVVAGRIKADPSDALPAKPASRRSTAK